jgi:hypothetical protein
MFCFNKQIYTTKDIDQQINQIIECLANIDNDWSKRVDSVLYT